MRKGIDTDASRWFVVNQAAEMSKIASIPEMLGSTYQRMMGDLDQTGPLASWFRTEVATRVLEYEKAARELLPELSDRQIKRLAGLEMDHVMPYWMVTLREVDELYGDEKVWTENGGTITIPVMTEWYDRGQDRYMRIPVERVASLFPSFLTKDLYPVDLNVNGVVTRTVGKAFVCADQNRELLNQLSENRMIGQGLYDLNDLASGKGRLVEIHKQLFGCLPPRSVSQMLENLKGIVIVKEGFWSDVFSDKYGDWYLYLSADFWGDDWKEVDEGYFARLNCLATRMEAKAKYRLLGMMPDSYLVGMCAARETSKYLEGSIKARELKKNARTIDGTEAIDWWSHIYYSYQHLVDDRHSSGMHHLKYISKRDWSEKTFQQDYMEELDMRWRNLAPKLITLRGRREKLYEE